MVKIKMRRFRVGGKVIANVAVRGNKVTGAGMAKIRKAAKAEGVGQKSGKAFSSNLKDGKLKLVNKSARTGTTTGTHGG